MKICRFSVPGKSQIAYGVFNQNQTATVLDTQSWSLDKLILTDEIYSRAEIELLPPVAPSKIVCVGRNYQAHAAELGNEVPSEPLLFLKAPSSIVTSHQPIILPRQSSRVEHEGELAVVIKRLARNLSLADNPFDYILGYACLNDVTARDLQRRDVQFTRAKSFDTFCPIGEFIETVIDPSNLDLTVRVNDAVKQQGNTAQMIFPVPEIIRYISNQMTLLPGDVIATGTPSGVSQLNPGDQVTVEIQGLEALVNPVVAF